MPMAYSPGTGRLVLTSEARYRKLYHDTPSYCTAQCSYGVRGGLPVLCTDLANGATTGSLGGVRVQVRYPALRACYAMPGTDLAYGAISLCAAWY
eukprot:2190311-Rhodomonas_salina.2